MVVSCLCLNLNLLIRHKTTGLWKTDQDEGEMSEWFNQTDESVSRTSNKNQAKTNSRNKREVKRFQRQTRGTAGTLAEGEVPLVHTTAREDKWDTGANDPKAWTLDRKSGNTARATKTITEITRKHAGDQFLTLVSLLRSPMTDSAPAEASTWRMTRPDAAALKW